jgi:hypothetical protein
MGFAWLRQGEKLLCEWSAHELTREVAVRVHFGPILKMFSSALCRAPRSDARVGRSRGDEAERKNDAGGESHDDTCVDTERRGAGGGVSTVYHERTQSCGWKGRILVENKLSLAV